jgi:hypothetical protein
VQGCGPLPTPQIRCSKNAVGMARARRREVPPMPASSRAPGPQLLRRSVALLRPVQRARLYSTAYSRRIGTRGCGRASRPSGSRHPESRGSPVRPKYEAVAREPTPAPPVPRASDRYGEAQGQGRRVADTVRKTSPRPQRSRSRQRPVGRAVRGSQRGEIPSLMKRSVIAGGTRVHHQPPNSSVARRARDASSAV